jgi:hypothetical protein
MTKLIGMVVSSTSSGTIAFHDSDAAATTITVIATMTPAAGSTYYFGAGGITFSKGLYVVIANTLQCTLIYE